MRGFVGAIAAVMLAAAAMGQEQPATEISKQAVPGLSSGTEPGMDGVIPPIRTGPLHVCSSYPLEAVLKRLSGTTVVKFLVTAQGTVSDLTIAQSSGAPTLDNASVDCVANWRYVPATKNGVPVAYPWTVVVSWAASGIPLKFTRPASAADTAKVDACLSIYPPVARAAGAEGETTLRFTVDANGNVKNNAVAVSSGNAELDAAAQHCTAQQRYEPAIKDGEAVDSTLMRKVVWKIADGPLRPQLLKQVSCRGAGISPKLPDDPNWQQGAAKVAFTIEDGKARNFSVVTSSGFAAIDEATIRCVKLWEYSKLLRNGVPAAAQGTATVIWHRPASPATPKP